jgi:hypothetical protein
VTQSYEGWGIDCNLASASFLRISLKYSGIRGKFSEHYGVLSPSYGPEILLYPNELGSRAVCQQAIDSNLAKWRVYRSPVVDTARTANCETIGSLCFLGHTRRAVSRYDGAYFKPAATIMMLILVLIFSVRF